MVEARQTWKNNLEPHRNRFNILPIYFKWQPLDRQAPELALRPVTPSASVEHALDIADDRSGIEVRL